KRYYTETRHAVAPVVTTDFGDLFALTAALRAVPLREKTTALAPFTTVGPDVPLRPDWFTSVRPFLEAVVSGQRVAVIDPALPPEQFFERALTCLACLPGTLRWRMPIGCGLYDVPSEDSDKMRFALVHGAKGSGRLRWENEAFRAGANLSAG